MPITPLPTPPSTSDPSTFATKADALLAALPTFVTETNAIASDFTAIETATDANALACVNAQTATEAFSNATKWISGTTYGQGDVVWSPINYYPYRRIIAGAGTTDPSLDGTNWVLITLAQASQLEAETGTENTKYMSALRVKQSIDANSSTNSISQLNSNITVTDAGTGKVEATIDGTVIEELTLASRKSTIDGGSTLYPEFKCRAWVNFNGTGTVAIRASGNVSSITDNGTGDYTINFTTALPDTNYSVSGISTGATTGNTSRNVVIKGADGTGATLKSTSQLTIQTCNVATVFTDMAEVNIQIFR